LVAAREESNIAQGKATRLTRPTRATQSAAASRGSVLLRKLLAGQTLLKHELVLCVFAMNLKNRVAVWGPSTQHREQSVAIHRSPRRALRT
jgi:hypothetical protein